MTIKPLIQLKNINKHYDDVQAVVDLTLTIAQGELLVLLGASGCGKTTTLRLIAGLERPTSGEVWLEGNQVASANAWVPPEARRIGMVFQDYALFPHLTVGQNIGFAISKLSKKQRHKRIRETLDLVGLPQLAARYPHQLSGGQQQRVALARALAAEPSVVLLDEPFSNLDAARRKHMREEVRRILKEAQATAVFVTHDQEEALRLADRVAVMRGGELLQVGHPAEVYRYPAQPQVAHFLGEVNELPGQADGETVQTALGALPLARPSNGAVTALVRPEALLIDVACGHHNATLVERRFYGFYEMLALRLDAGLQVEARVWAQDDLRPGDRVCVQVRGSVVAFPTTEAKP